MPSPAPTLELLLADPTDHAPLLPEGLAADAADRAPRPARMPRGVDEPVRDAPDAHPGDLPKQRWGVIAPPGPRGDAALEALGPLLRLREAEQGAPPRVYRDAPTDGSVEKAVRWRNEVWRKGPDAERPRYLFILGDADEHGFELGHVLAQSAFVGRLCADGPEGYAAYAEKVVRWARAPSAAERPDALFFVARDGTAATAQGRMHLVEPSVVRARAPGFPAAEVVRLPQAESAAAFVSDGDRERPAVLLSVSHGAGTPAQGWRSPEEQRARQGALIVTSGRVDALLTADHVRGARFLPGGMWFCLACFSAGTPSQSVYHAWLSALGYAQARAVLDGLPAGGARPFAAALPMAALASPGGPLAVVGHVDLAWTYGFTDGGAAGPPVSRPDRILGAVESMARGSRAGVALDALMRAYREVNDELLSGYQIEADDAVRGKPSPVDPRRRGTAFMLRNDLRGYVLLGDPAVRLPLAGTGPAPAADRPAPGVTTEAAAPDAAARERAVLAVLGKEPAEEVASRLGIPRAVLDAWVAAYCAAGRSALAKR